MKTKTEIAKEFIAKIRTMENEELHKLLIREMGDELTRFCMDYAFNLIIKDPARVLENTSALMTLGYLIKVNEEKVSLAEALTQKPALA